MNRRIVLALAVLPGFLLTLAAVAGWSPGLRDAPSYFAPLRARTAEVLRGSRSPWWDPDVGCGEPYFANPQTTLLYPPAWPGLVLAPEAAVGAEAGLHLALLGAGCALLALALGGRPGWAVAAAWAAVVAGPSIDAVGVLNNLETLAWLPWMWWAVASGRLRWLPLFVACSWLAAEPQLALLGVAMAVTLVPSRRALAAAALGLGMVAIQAVPFAFWVAAGDRGPGLLADVRGALGAGQLPGLIFAGAGRAAADAFIVHPTVPLWAAVLGLVALWRCRGPARRLAVWGWALVVAAVVAGLPGGDVVWETATLGLVRYPARLLLITAVALPPVAAVAGTSANLKRLRAVGVAAVALVVGFAVGGSVPALAGQVGTLGAALGGPWPALAAAVGSGFLGPVHLPALELRRTTWSPVPCLDAQLRPGRVYSLEPSREQLEWLAVAPQRRAAALGYGYTPLLDGRRAARSFAPLMARQAARHLAAADAGPSGRWWLDSLAATTLVGQRRVEGFGVRCEQDGVVVMANPSAWPEVSVVRALPEPGSLPVPAGEVVAAEQRDAAAIWEVSVAAGGGVLQWLATPDRGWRWRVDGRPVSVLQGRGILHGVALALGSHRVEVRYLPPGLAAGTMISLLALIGVVVAWRRS